MTAKVTIGDGKAMMINANVFKTYAGTISIVKIENYFHVQLSSDSKRHVVLPCEEILSCTMSMVKETITLQLQEDYVWENVF
jgi:hypothetical protein